MNIWDEVIQEFVKEQNRLRDTLGSGGAEDFAQTSSRFYSRN